MLSVLCYILPLMICGFEPPQVSTKWSNIMGFVQVFNGRRINIFQGIPYAEPPIGENRFRPPIPLQSSNFISSHYAGNFRANCFSKGIREAATIRDIYFDNEDCLYLNIWIPESAAPSGEDKNSKLVPVLVIMNHQRTNVKNIDGKVLAAQGDLAVVTFNYRLQIFGIIQDGDGSISYSALFHDTKSVLHWIQENIAQFGGDPRRVTLLADGWQNIEVALQLKDIDHHQSILMNGLKVETPSAEQDFDWNDLDLVAGRLGCLGGPSRSDVLQCLRKFRGKEILAAYSVPRADERDQAEANSVEAQPELPSLPNSLRLLHGARISSQNLMNTMMIQVISQHELSKISTWAKRMFPLLPGLTADMIERYSRQDRGQCPERKVNQGQNYTDQSEWLLQRYFECPFLELSGKLSSPESCYSVSSVLIDSSLSIIESSTGIHQRLGLTLIPNIDLITGKTLESIRFSQQSSEVNKFLQSIVQIVSKFVTQGVVEWPGEPNQQANHNQNQHDGRQLVVKFPACNNKLASSCLAEKINICKTLDWSRVESRV